MKINNEVKIGIMATCVLIFLIILTIKTGDFHFSKKGYTLTVQFQDIDGVSLNAPVMLNGLEVGFVKDIKIKHLDDETVMELVVWMREDAKLKEGAKAYVKNMGFMGEKYIGLTSGKGNVYVKAGGTILGEEPADLDKLMAEGQVIAKEIKEISQNLNERLKKNKEAIDRIFNNLDVSMEKVRSISTNVDERLAVNDQKIDEIIENLRTSAINLDQFTYDLKQNPWKLMYRAKAKREAHIKMGDTRTGQINKEE